MILLSDRADVDLWEIPISNVTELIAGGVQEIFPLEFFSFDHPILESVQTRVHIASVRHPVVETAQEDQDLVEAKLTRNEIGAAVRREIETSLELRILEEQMRVTRVCDEFGRDRQRYFAAAETQVIRLALAIARRVLSREVKVNPLHLESTVRSALDKVQDGSESVLRVNAADVEEWTMLFATGGEYHVRVLGEDRIARGECMLETNVGRVDLNVETQIGEIERGFDELTQRHSA